MVGARTPDEQLLYPVSELASQYGASAEEETPSGEQAYARFERLGGVIPKTITPQPRIGNAEVDFRILEIDRIDFVRHGR